MSRLHSTSRPAVGRVRPYAALALTAICCTLSGCGAMTTAPVAISPSAAAPAQAALRGAGIQAAAGARQMAPGDPSDPNDGGSSGGSGGGSAGGSGPSAPVSSLGVLTTFNARHAASGSVVSRSATVGTMGFSLTSGRWRLDVPANALPVGTRVTLTAANGRGPAVEIATLPVNPGAFGSPLTLSVDTRGAASTHTGDFVILAYDTTSSAWQPVADSKASRKQKSVSASVSVLGVFGVGYPDGTPAW